MTPMRGGASGDAYVTSAGATAFNGEADGALHDHARRQFVGRGRWYAICDLDEFHVVPGFAHFEEATRAAERAGAAAICGRLIDRIALKGILPRAVNPRRFLGPQFPLACDITENISKGCSTKVLFAKSFVPIRPGHHRVSGQQVWDFTGDVHHFKWFRPTIDEQERRAISYRHQGLYYHEESERLLRYLGANGKKIPLSDPLLNTRIVIPDPLYRT